jgi:hypothetical protein
MLGMSPENQRDDRCATSDRVMLPDGQILTVPRTNLAAAKSALAARKAAERRVADANVAPRKRATQLHMV